MKKDKMRNIFYIIGSNPVPFIYGWFSAMIGFVIFFLFFGI